LLALRAPLRHVSALRVLAVEEEEMTAAAPAPRTTGAVVEDAAVDAPALAQAFNDFLNSLEDLERELTGLLARLGPVPWALMGLALVGTAYGTIKRRQLRRGRPSAADGRAVRFNWVAG